MTSWEIKRKENFTISSAMRPLTRPPEPAQVTAMRARGSAAQAMTGRAADSGGPTVPADRAAAIRNIISRAVIWMTSSEIFSEICSITETGGAGRSSRSSGFGGSGFGGGSFPQKGSDVYADVTVGFDEAAFGCDKVIRLQDPSGRTGGVQSLQVHIPAGIDTGKSIRLKGKGMPGANGGEAGDLFLKVTVAPKPGYERKGTDVYTTVSIPYTTAVFGGEAVVGTLYGNVVCKIREGTQSGTKIRLRGKGIVFHEKPVCAG